MRELDKLRADFNKHRNTPLAECLVFLDTELRQLHDRLKAALAMSDEDLRASVARETLESKERCARATARYLVDAALGKLN